MIRRERDLDFINSIANSERVRPFIDYRGVDAPLDFAPAVDRPVTGCVILSNGEDAIAAFELTDERRWQAHTMFAVTCRGRRAVDTGRAMVAFMAPWADVLWGATPMANRAARWFNRQIGAVVVGHDDYEAEGPVEIFEVRLH